MTISNGSVADADEVLEMSRIIQVYTGSGFDSSQVGGGIATDTQDHELDAVSDAINSNYVVVKITGEASVSSSGASSSLVELKAQIKETGGAYSDIVAYKIVNKTIVSPSTSVNGQTLEIVATLTAGQKTNGFQIKVFSQSVLSNGTSASFVNTQTIQELRT